jgi:hypothetical protein
MAAGGQAEAGLAWLLAAQDPQQRSAAVPYAQAHVRDAARWPALCADLLARARADPGAFLPVYAAALTHAATLAGAALAFRVWGLNSDVGLPRATVHGSARRLPRVAPARWRHGVLRPLCGPVSDPVCGAQARARALGGRRGSLVAA